MSVGTYVRCRPKSPLQVLWLESREGEEGPPGRPRPKMAQTSPVWWVRGRQQPGALQAWSSFPSPGPSALALCESMAAVTHDCNFSGCKQHTPITYRTGGQNEPPGLRSTGLVPSGGSRGKPVSLPFPASRGHRDPLARGPFLQLPSWWR